MSKNKNVINYLSNPQSTETTKTEDLNQNTENTNTPNIENIAKSAADSAVKKTVKKTESKPVPVPVPVPTPSSSPTTQIKEETTQTGKSAPEKTTPAEPEKDDIISNVNDEDKQTLSTLETLENAMPEKYKGIKERAVKYLKEAYNIQEKERERFYKENADLYDNEEQLAEGFQEHIDAVLSDLKQKYNVSWDESDYEKAEKELDKKPIVEELNKTKQEVQEIKKERVIEQLKPVYEKVFSESCGLLANALTDNSSKDINPLKEDEIIGDYVKQAEQHIALFNAALLTSIYGIADENTSNYINQCINLAEKEVMGLPEDKQIVNGKRFVPLKEYATLDDAAKSNCWTITPDIVLLREVNNVASQIKTIKDKEEEKIKKVIEKRYKYKPQILTKKELENMENDSGVKKSDVEKKPNVLSFGNSYNNKPQSPSVTSKQEIPSTSNTPLFRKNSSLIGFLSGKTKK